MARESVFILMLFIELIVGRAWAEPAQVPRRACILVYERAQSPIAQKVAEMFKNYRPAAVTLEARPVDIVKCIDSGFEELVIVAHAFELQDSVTATGNFEVRLGYFTRAPKSDSSEDSPYQAGFFLDHVFKLAHRALAKRRAAGLPSVTKIRFMACDMKQIFINYPSFERLIRDNSIALDVAPSHSIVNLFRDANHKVTPFDVEWLSKTVDCFSLNEWQTESNRFCRNDWWGGCDRETAKICLPTNRN
jgi:hypothetical protein